MNKLQLDGLDLDHCYHFNFREFNNKFLLTNDLGFYILLSDMDFQRFLKNEIPKDQELFEALASKFFLRTEENVQEFQRLYLKKNRHLNLGPNLHIVIMTLRCDHHCIYCQASRKQLDDSSCDMDESTAREVVNFILSGPNKELTIEFQGGEPLLNFPVVKFIVEEVESKIAAGLNKTVTFTVVTNLSFMDETILDFIMQHKIQICTSLDGPEEIHNKNRALKGSNSYQHTVQWIEKLIEHQTQLELQNKGPFPRPNALLTVSRYSLEHAKAIVDEYVKWNFNTIHIRPINPFGFAHPVWKKISYTTEEFLKFYFECIDYLLQLNKKGHSIGETTAQIFLNKMMFQNEPNFLDLRSPCGAGIGQIAYNYDGHIFTCDEGRMMAEMGDDTFCIGHVKDLQYNQIVESEVVKGLCIASCLDGLPGCISCAFRPYCGTCPIFNYVSQGNIFGRMPDNEKCKLHTAIFEYFFHLLDTGEEETLKILKKWALSIPFFFEKEKS